MTEVETYERVTIIIREILSPFDSETITEESTWEDLQADSLDRVGIVMRCEEEFDMEISDSDAETMMTVGDLVGYVARNR